MCASRFTIPATGFRKGRISLRLSLRPSLRGGAWVYLSCIKSSLPTTAESNTIALPGMELHLGLACPQRTIARRQLEESNVSAAGEAFAQTRRDPELLDE